MDLEPRGMICNRMRSVERSTAIATTTPAARSNGIRTGHVERSTAKRALSQNTNGVTTAHIHESTNSIAIGAAGEPNRKPAPRGSRRRLTEERVAMKVQKTKISRMSRALKRLSFCSGLIALDYGG